MFPEFDLSLDALRALQLTRLKEALRHAYDHQAPYRAKCEAAGVHPDDLRSLDDLKRFPFTAKSDLRDAYPFGMFAIPREQCVRVHASSGTTGRPTVVGYSEKDIATWAELMARSLYAGGARTSSTMPTATACSPAGWARITAPSGSAVRWCRCRAASASARSN
jgi:phenylacetate-CoA ligase